METMQEVISGIPASKLEEVRTHFESMTKRAKTKKALAVLKFTAWQVDREIKGQVSN